MGLPRLNRKLVLETPNQVPDGAGGFVLSWEAVGQIWGEVSARTGRERSRPETPVSSMSYRIVVRSAPYGAPLRPQPEQRFREGGRVFVIRAVAEKGTDGRYLICFADEEVAV